MKALTLGAAVALWSVSIAAGPAALAADVKGATEAEWAKTVAAARREGKLGVFVYQRGNIEAAVKEFEKKYPEIQVTVVGTSASQTGPRLMAERRAEKYLWDICICGPTTPYAVLYRAQALDPIKPALALPEVVDPSPWWGGKHHYLDPEGSHILVFLGTVDMPNVYYNKNLVDPKDFQSYADLLDARWRGKIVVIDPRKAGRQRVGARFLYHIPNLGAPFLTRLFQEADVVLSRDDRQAMDWLAVGKYAICLFCGDIETAKAQGLPLEEFNIYRWKDAPAVYSGSNGTLALLNRAPHPNAARVFINWLLSREGQISYQKIMNTPDLIMESMRVDIPKDPVPANKRRAAGVNYILMDTPERSDQAPVARLLGEVIKN